jgi:hypothetical protein
LALISHARHDTALTRAAIKAVKYSYKFNILNPRGFIACLTNSIMNKANTQICHITKSNTHIFSEVDSTDEEAKRYHAGSQTLIAQALKPQNLLTPKENTNSSDYRDVV